jgi:hypothetical protein
VNASSSNGSEAQPQFGTVVEGSSSNQAGITQEQFSQLISLLQQFGGTDASDLTGLF